MRKQLFTAMAFCLFMVSFFGLRSQSSLLKSFINTNDIAIRSVQKYSINSTDPNADVNLKELLVFQSASVKLFSSNPGKSADIAFMVREKCSQFLTKNSRGSLEFLALSDKEKKFFSSPKTVEKVGSVLNKKENEKINSVDTKDPRLFEDLNTRIK